MFDRLYDAKNRNHDNPKKSESPYQRYESDAAGAGQVGSDLYPS